MLGKIFSILFMVILCSTSKAQDDVFIVEEPGTGFFDVYTQFSVIQNRSESPMTWGGGFGLSYVSNPFSYKPIFIGGEINYIFSSADNIVYNGDEYLRNSSSITNLNFISQIRYFRNNNFGIYPEITFGLTMPGYASTFIYYDNTAGEEISELEKMRLFFAPAAGFGIGIKLWRYFNFKFRYQASGPVKQFHPEQVYEIGTDIYYPYVKVPLNRFEFYVTVSLNKL